MADNKTTEVAETKADKFKRIGNSRLAKALDAIAALKGLANTASYEYSDDQVAKIGEALTKGVQEVGTVFAAKGAVKKSAPSGIL